MATRFCDHGLYAAPVAGGTVPTAAEDGNGAAKTAATMATLVITFTGIPTADGAITIAGVTFTAKASGATGNQFNAVTDAATCATNLKNAINASATNAIKPAGAIAATAPLRNVVNATVSGAVVTIYTRCAGSEWNSVVETSTLTNASITAQWSGGADGAWGYMLNAAVLWPTAIGLSRYGVLSKTRCYVGSFTIGADKVICRSGKTIYLIGNLPGNYCEFGAWPGASQYTRFTVEIDNGTEWPADGSTPKTQLIINNGYNTAVGTPDAANYLYLKSPVYSDGTYGLTIKQTSGSFPLRIFMAWGLEVEGVLFTSSNQYCTFNGPEGNASNITSQAIFRNCEIMHGANAPFFHLINNNYRTCYATMSGVKIRTTYNASHSGTIRISNFTRESYLGFWLDSCQFLGFVGSSKLFESITWPQAHNSIFFRNCDFASLANTGPTLAISSLGVLTTNVCVAASSQFGNRDFFVDTYNGYVEWRSNRSFPTLNAKLLDGTTPWSIHIVPTTYSDRLSRSNFVETPRIGKINSLADGVRTLTVEFAVHDSQTFTLGEISAFIDYQTPTGTYELVDTFDNTHGALTASTSTWSSESGGKVTYVDGVLQSHNKYKFSVTTPKSIASGTEIGITIRIHKHVDTAVQGVFVDPEIQVS